MSDEMDTTPEQQFVAQIAAAVMGDLREERDEHLALRKAVLALLLIHADDGNPLLEDFHSFLLVEFEPLAKHFANHSHPIVGGQIAVRGRTHDGRDRLFIDEAVAHYFAEYSEDADLDEEL